MISSTSFLRPLLPAVDCDFRASFLASPNSFTSQDLIKTNLCVSRMTMSMTTFGDKVVKTANNLTAMNELYLVYPWIRPLLDQEFSGGAARLDKMIQALRLVVRLRQPFGMLLFDQMSRIEYKRVTADVLTMVQVRKEAPLTDLMANTIERHHGLFYSFVSSSANYSLPSPCLC